MEMTVCWHNLSISDSKAKWGRIVEACTFNSRVASCTRLGCEAENSPGHPGGSRAQFQT